MRAGGGGPGPGGRGSGTALPPCLAGAAEASPGRDSQRTVLAVFLGGCTCSEMAALRFLGRERGAGARGGGGRRGRGAEPRG